MKIVMLATLLAGPVPGAAGRDDPVAGAAQAASPAVLVPPAAGPGAAGTPVSGQGEAPAGAPARPDASTPGAEIRDPAIVVTGGASAPDPARAINAQTFEAVQAVDKAVVGPVAKAYEKGMPDPARAGLRNVLRNLEEPVIFLNNILQLRFGRALKSAGRFALNSTIGLAGLVDVAKGKPFGLPYRYNGFANTFACYGIGPGPYLFLPLVGPTTVRDVIGLTMDRAALPLAVGPPLSNPEIALPAAVIDSLNDRIEIDGQLRRMREEEADPYIATRELYLRQRAAEIARSCGRGDVPVDPGLPPRAGKGED